MDADAHDAPGLIHRGGSVRGQTPGGCAAIRRRVPRPHPPSRPPYSACRVTVQEYCLVFSGPVQGVRALAENKMRQLLIALAGLYVVYGGEAAKSSGISDFWTDDYKVFEQIYGKTSDKDLYGDTLPSISLADLGKKRPEASEKKERYIDSEAFSDFDTYSFGDHYAKIFAKQILNDDIKPAKPQKSFNFISYNDFKPISQDSDPETYDYLKHLEEFNKEKKIKTSKGNGGFKPYLGYSENQSEENQAYRSIQDILDAHEANKGNNNSEDDRDEQIKYLTYGGGISKKLNSRKKPGGEKPGCWSGRCRKRAINSYRVRSRPYIRKIIQDRWH
ncbi:hypothetical protein evm_013586 [Chilo suppressalis]|nr:hypothetical protein evm_013586 [Chilo suppressalis]